jgi:non-ribosomal peptide synthetase component F
VVDGPWSEARCLAFAESAGVEPAGAAPADGDSHAHAIVEAIHRHAERSPSAIALDDGDTRLTYAELWQQADALRQAIHGCGIGPGDRVALVLPRSLAFVVAALACWRCGASYISVDPTSPPDRIASILECARPQLVWTGSEATPGGANWEAQASRASPSSSRAARGGGYVVFTSGSTGTPKGVIVSEPSLAAMVTATIRHFEIGARDAVGALANIAFDAHAIEIWPALSAGARLVMSHERTFDSVERLLSWLATNTISVCWLPTPVTELLIDQGCRLPPSLRVLYTAGQRLTKRAPHWDALRFENAYGPSETTVIATSGPVAATDGPTSAFHWRV